MAAGYKQRDMREWRCRLFQHRRQQMAFEMVDADGNKYDLTGKPVFSLCRCGGSVNKPFCDGTHSRIGFQGAELAVKKVDG